MATWRLNDSAPATVGQEFDTPASPWTESYTGLPGSIPLSASQQQAVHGTATPSGLSLSASIGIALVAGAALIGATGVEARTATSQAVVQASARTSPAGSDAHTDIGQVTPGGSASTVANGASIASVTGSATAMGTGVVAPTGLAFTDAVGVASAEGEQTSSAVAPGSSVWASSYVGQSGASGAAVAAPEGTSAALIGGEAVASWSKDGTATVDGDVALASVGSGSAIGSAETDVMGCRGCPTQVGAASVQIINSDGQLETFAVAVTAPSDHASVGTVTATGSQNDTRQSGGWSLAGPYIQPRYVDRVEQHVQVWPTGVSARTAVGRPTAKAGSSVRLRTSAKAMSTAGRALVSTDAMVTPRCRALVSRSMARQASSGSAQVRPRTAQACVRIGCVKASGTHVESFDEEADELFLLGAIGQ